MNDNKGEHPFGDTGQLLFLGVFLVVWAGDSFFLKVSSFLSDYVPLYIRLAFLAILLIVSAALSRAGHVVVAQEERPSRVIEDGIFRYVRHPLYLASLFACMGLVMSTLSLLSLAAWLGVFVFYNYIATYEERIMEMKFGEAYRAYKKKTGKWLPKVVGGR